MDSGSMKGKMIWFVKPLVRMANTILYHTVNIIMTSLCQQGQFTSAAVYLKHIFKRKPPQEIKQTQIGVTGHPLRQQ